MAVDVQQLQQKIEDLRRKLNEETKRGLLTQECYLVSVQLDQLVEEYMEYRDAQKNTERGRL